MRFKYIIKWKGYEIPTITLIIFLVVTIWSVGMIIAPLTLPSNSVKDLTGSVGKVENEDITEDMNPYAKHYYEAGDVNCHQIKERSFFINGNQMPFCARDVAIFFGIALGLGIALFIAFEVKLWWLIGGLIPIGLDGGLQLLTSYESNNLFRVLTGGLAGIVVAFALGYVIYDASKAGEMKRLLAAEPPMEGELYSDSVEGGEPSLNTRDQEEPMDEMDEGEEKNPYSPGEKERIVQPKKEEEQIQEI